MNTTVVCQRNAIRALRPAAHMASQRLRPMSARVQVPYHRSSRLGVMNLHIEPLGDIDVESSHSVSDIKFEPAPEHVVQGYNKLAELHPKLGEPDHSKLDQLAADAMRNVSQVLNAAKRVDQMKDGSLPEQERRDPKAEKYAKRQW